MKTIPAFLTLLFILIVDTEEIVAEFDDIGLEGRSAKSPLEAQVPFYSPSQAYVQSIYGTYNPSKCCWKSGPRAPRLRVGNHCQSVAVRRKIECKLSKNAAVKRAIERNAKHCDLKHYQDSAGLLDTCSSRYHRATEVWYLGKKCYIVRPHQQCVTYRRCNRKRSDCGTSDGKGNDDGNGSGNSRDRDNDGNGGNSNLKRSTLNGLLSRRGETSKGGGCYGTFMSSSTCLPDGYRTFPVWIYCDYCGLKLINLELPQCCSCKRYNKCYDVKTLGNA